MVVTISDEFDVEKTVYSGQCFRPRKLSNGQYLFITGNEYLILEQLQGAQYEVSCDENTWELVWKRYFDLELNYADIRRAVRADDTFMVESSIAGEGIRILRQDKWEMLISYIISQRKSIPAIRTAVEKICKLYGRKLAVVDGEEIYAFPSALEMHRATEEELAACGLGYRTSYILDAIRLVSEGMIDLEAMDSLDDQTLFDSLKAIKGVGDKVANCVLLFAYHRISRAPVDTWILKVINERYNGVNPFDSYGQHAGIMQQYVFYYVQNRKGLS